MEIENKRDVENNKLIAAVGYLWILCLVPLLLRKDSPYAQYHGKQGLVLTVVSVLLWLFGWVVALIPFLGWLIVFCAWIGIVVLALMGVVNALSGKMWEMPFFGVYAKEVKL